MSYPYHMALWNRWQHQAAMKKGQRERQAQVMPAMKKRHQQDLFAPRHA